MEAITTRIRTGGNVNLSFKSLGDDGALALAAVLSEATEIETLDLSCNSLGSAGAAAVAAAISKLEKASFFNRMHLRLLKKGMRWMQLTSLDLSANAIGDDGVAAIAPLIAANRPVRKGDIPCTVFDSPVLASILHIGGSAAFDDRLALGKHSRFWSHSDRRCAQN